MKKYLGIISGAALFAGAVIVIPFILVEQMVKQNLDARKKTSPPDVKKNKEETENSEKES